MIITQTKLKLFTSCFIKTEYTHLPLEVTEMFIPHIMRSLGESRPGFQAKLKIDEETREEQ